MMKKLVQNYLLLVAVMFGGMWPCSNQPQHMRQAKFRLFQATVILRYQSRLRVSLADS